MIEIKRQSDGTHTIDGKPIDAEITEQSGLYRKRHLTRAMHMARPFSVETLEGTMKGKAGDWLMIGVKGEMYPCDADIFERTYEPAQE